MPDSPENPSEASPFASGESIAPQQLSQLLNARLIDVRTPAEFRRVHAKGATNVPLDRLDPASLAGSEPVYLICRGGARSREAAQRFRESAPRSTAMVVEGGTLAWIEAGLPVVRGKPKRRPPKTSSIVVGTIIVISGLLAIFVHRGLFGFAGLAAAWIVAINTLDPRQWPWRQDEDVTEKQPTPPG